MVLDLRARVSRQSTVNPRRKRFGVDTCSTAFSGAPRSQQRLNHTVAVVIVHP